MKYEFSRRGGASGWVVCGLACLVLLASGIVYQVAAGRLERLGEAVALPVPLKRIPLKIGGWAGEDVPLSETVQEVAGNDDFVNRLYRNDESNAWVSLYVAYSGDPRTMLGHRPQVCYPASGWQHETTDRIKLKTARGRDLPCLLHRFYRANSEGSGVVVLNFYLLNGQITDDEGTFSGVGWRLPNISGDIARYVVQVQITSVLEKSVRDAARDMVDLILNYLPDERGSVGAAEKKR